MVRKLLGTILAVALILPSVLIPARAGSLDPAGWYVVRYSHRITSNDRASLDLAGAGAVTYGRRGSYVAWLDAEALERVGRLPHVGSVTKLPPRAKLADSLDVDSHPLIDVAIFSERTDEVVQTLEEVVDVVGGYVADPERGITNVVVRAARTSVTEIAAESDVLAIGPSSMGIELLDEGAAQIVAGNVREGLPVPGYRRFLKRLGLSGRGVTLAIADSGIDDQHPDLAGRVKKRVDYTALPDYRDTDGHGTHVAGIAAGSGTGVPGAQDPDGFAYGQGIAPKASLLDIGVLGIIEETVGLDEFPPFERATRFASRNGAFGWNASWGSGEGDRAGYTQTARTMDMLARDADWKKKGLQPFTLVFAAGNSGQAGPGAPTEAKNLISVASSRSHRAGDIETISSFSSRGPTRDGRIGPTVAAPGEQIVSTRSSSGSVLCNTPPLEPAPFAALYGVCSGTSMAAPQVAGSTALIAEWWRERRGGAMPSPAMTKALLVNSAEDMGAPDVPNVEEGWGRVDLKALFDPRTKRIYRDQNVRFDEAGDSFSFSARALNPRRPLKVTLVWSDAPAAPNAKRALVNDLDLRVKSRRGTFWGNRFSKGRSITGGGPDRREVVESVFVKRPRGIYRVRIEASDLPGDGIPLSGDKTDQDFALVVSNVGRVRGS